MCNSNWKGQREDHDKLATCVPIMMALTLALRYTDLSAWNVFSLL